MPRDAGIYAPGWGSPMENPRRRRRLVALVAAAVLAATAAGCSSGSFSGSGENRNAAARTGSCVSPGVTDDKIKIGLVFPDTGPLASILGPSRAGMEARLGLANEQGGVHGRRIEYVWRDDATDPAINAAVVRELVEREEVFGLIQSSTASSGGAEYLREKGIPVAGLPAETIWTDPANQHMFAYSYLFTDGPSVDTYGRFVRAQGATRVAVITSDLAAAADTIGSKIVESLRAAGVEVLPQPFVYNPNVTSARLLGQQLREAGVDVITGAMSGEDMAAVIQGARDAGANIKFLLAPSGYDPGLLQQYGAKLAGMTTFVNYVPFEANTPAHEAYLAAMARYAPEMRNPQHEIAFVNYILTDLFIRGLQEAGPCPTREKFIRNLRAVSDYDAGGLIACQVDLTRDFGQLSTCYTFVRVNPAGTAFEIVENNTPGAPSRTQWCGERLEH